MVLVDVVEGVPQGKGLDMLESAPVEGYDVSIVGSNGYEETAESDIVVITAGFPRKPGMSRDDLLLANYEVVKSATQQAARHSPERDSDPGHQPARRHVPDCAKVSGSARTGHWYGRRTRHRAFPDLHRRRVKRLG